MTEGWGSCSHRYRDASAVLCTMVLDTTLVTLLGKLNWTVQVEMHTRDGNLSPPLVTTRQDKLLSVNMRNSLHAPSKVLPASWRIRSVMPTDNPSFSSLRSEQTTQTSIDLAGVTGGGGSKSQCSHLTHFLSTKKFAKQSTHGIFIGKCTA